MGKYGRAEFTNKHKQIVYETFKGRCFDCGIKLQGGWEIGGGGIYEPRPLFSIKHANIHHIIPLYHGGKHKFDNWVLLCEFCHKQRHIIIAHTDYLTYKLRLNNLGF